MDFNICELSVGLRYGFLLDPRSPMVIGHILRQKSIWWALSGIFSNMFFFHILNATLLIVAYVNRLNIHIKNMKIKKNIISV